MKSFLYHSVQLKSSVRTFKYISLRVDKKSLRDKLQSTKKKQQDIKEPLLTYGRADRTH